MTADDAVFGRGLAFPPHVGPDGRMAWSQGEANVRQGIQIVILTEPGERQRLPAFGSGLRPLLFAPNTTPTWHDIAERIRRAVTDWEPRVRVLAVDVVADPADERAALATLTYELVATRDVGALTLSITVRG
jgi:phage baseplate assembly protein W